MLLLIQDYLILVATMVEIITQQKHVIGKMVYRLTASPIEEVKEVEGEGGQEAKIVVVKFAPAMVS